MELYGVAAISRLLKIIGLCCRRALWKRRYSAKETYDFQEPNKRSHPIALVSCSIVNSVDSRCPRNKKTRNITRPRRKERSCRSTVISCCSFTTVHVLEKIYYSRQQICSLLKSVKRKSAVRDTRGVHVTIAVAVMSRTVELICCTVIEQIYYSRQQICCRL